MCSLHLKLRFLPKLRVLKPAGKLRLWWNASSAYSPAAEAARAWVPASSSHVCWESACLGQLQCRCVSGAGNRPRLVVCPSAYSRSSLLGAGDPECAGMVNRDPGLSVH